MKENKRKAAQDTLCTKSNACILNKNVPGDFEQGRHFVYSVLPVPVCPLSVVISSVPAERTFSIKGAVENSAVKKMTRILSFWYICSELSLKISQKVVFPIKPTKLHKQAFVVEYGFKVPKNQRVFIKTKDVIEEETLRSAYRNLDEEIIASNF